MNGSEKRPSSFKNLAIVVLLTLVVSGGIGYWLGMGSIHVHQEHATMAEGEVEESTGEQLWTCGMHPWIVVEEPGLCPICEMDLTPLREDGTTDLMETAERKVIYWRAPMDPTEIYDEPGKSKMGMDLVPVYEDEIIGGVEVKIDPVTIQNMGVRTEQVEHGPLEHTIKTYGHVTYDETLSTQVSPRFSGWIEKMHVDFTGQEVARGEVLFEIYSPELISAQEEYLVAFKSLKTLEADAAGDLIESARRRLGYFGVAESEIKALEARGEAQRTMKIRSPVNGVVMEKFSQEGSFVKVGAPVYRLADLSRLWVEVHIYEYELPWVKLGQPARMTLPYIPGRDFTGEIDFITPYLDPKTRDVVVRLVYDNSEMELKPEMYADIWINHAAGLEGLLIPSEAVIRSGARNVVFVDRGHGKFTPRDVRLGPALDDGKVQVLEGLARGEYVVVSGQFLLDSESKLKEAVRKMLEAKRGEVKPEAQEEGDGFFEEMEGDGEGGENGDFFEGME